MKKICYLLILILMFFGNIFAQKTLPFPKPTPKIETNKKVEIPETDWRLLIDAISAENWKTAENLSLDYLKRLPKENDKKQIARLNYLYIFALEGQVAAGDLEFEKLDEILKNFVGREFLMPSRQILSNCKKGLNYICLSENKPNSLFVSATNTKATVIHSFEYFQLETPFDINKFKTQMAFLSGTLAEFSLNPRKSNTWIARLYFNKSQVIIIE